MKPYFVYSGQYDFKSGAISKRHPFDGAKFSKAWKLLIDKYPAVVQDNWIEPKEPVTDELLLKLHTPEYLESLKSSKTIAQVIEIWLAKYIPNKVLQNRLINPVKLACAGTILATETALKEKTMVMNFGGGYHHAFADHGEGFCFFADAALAINQSREKGLLSKNDKVLMIDLDAHRGNGFEAVTKDDKSILNFDMYNFQVYPGYHNGDPEEFPYMVPLKAGMDGDNYMAIVKSELIPFVENNSDAKLIIYNAGNDVFDSDPLGGLKVSYQHILERDHLVMDLVKKTNIPAVIVTSGGYTEASHKLIGEMAIHLMGLVK